MSNNINDFQFNDYIYLNTDFLESFIAQRYKGFPREMQIVTGIEYESSHNGKKTTTGVDTGANIGSNFLGGHGTFTETNEGEQFIQSNTETSQNVISKVLKDNMYNDFIKYIKEKNIVTSLPEVVVGKYIELYDTFYYMDFERIRKLCIEEYRTIFFENSENSTEFSYERFNSIREKVVLLQELIPFDAILYSQKFLILIDKDWLRIKKEHLGYILDGKINIIGKVNKVFEPQNEYSSMPEIIKILNNIQGYALSLLQELGFLLSDSIYIVTPIAIYR